MVYIVLRVAAARIIDRLTRNIVPTAAPPPVVIVKSPVIDLDPALFTDQHRLLVSLHSDFVTLVEYAK